VRAHCRLATNLDFAGNLLPRWLAANRIGRTSTVLGRKLHLYWQSLSLFCCMASIRAPAHRPVLVRSSRRLDAKEGVGGFGCARRPRDYELKRQSLINRAALPVRPPDPSYVPDPPKKNAGSASLRPDPRLAGAPAVRGLPRIASGEHHVLSVVRPIDG